MTIHELPGPGLSVEQWERLNTLAVTLKPGQALWLSGYFAGIEHSARALGDAAGFTLPQSTLQPQATQNADVRAITILYGSETGNSTGVAKLLSETLGKSGVKATLIDMADYKPRRLKDEQDLMIVTSTHGEGEPPLSALGFFEFVEGRKAPRLEGLRYTVLALGDSTYEHFCGAGKKLDHRLAELGASRLHNRIDCDVDYDEPASSWITKMVACLSETTGQAKAAASVATPVASDAPAYDKRNPFTATVIDNVTLTGRGSSKETRHIELSLAGSGLNFEPGDALGVVPCNEPAVVEALLGELSLASDAPLTHKGEQKALGMALSETLEITAATPRFIDNWAELSGAKELQDLRGENAFEARAAFLRANHVIDIVRRFPVGGVDASTFVQGLRPLQPRLYSIASSLSLAPDEVHVTVSTVRYDLNGEPRSGVASGQFSSRAKPDTALPVYVQANPHFRLPKNDAPIIMIGAGTGVAPYRAFLQEREATEAAGKSWLFFGERNFDSDFLYQTEWQDHLKEGTLTRMNVAFSRDSQAKTYVQHRLLEEARDVYAWLEEGAHIYICGDGARLAPDVHATLAEIIRKEGSHSKAAAGEYLDAMKSAHRYQIDVY